MPLAIYWDILAVLTQLLGPITAHLSILVLLCGLIEAMDDTICMVARMRAVHRLEFSRAYEVVELCTAPGPLTKECQGARMLRVIVLVTEFL